MKQDLLKKKARSFYWASFFLSSDTYEKCKTVYNFCRILDDITDEDPDFYKKHSENSFGENNTPTKILLTYKNFWRTSSDKVPEVEAMYKLFEHEKISRKLVEDLFDGFESDLKKKIKINSKKELLIYCYRVAGTVGLIMAKILRVKNKKLLRGAIDLGVAMQLTNIARDVIEDKKLGRQYIEHDFESIAGTIKLADIFYNNSFIAIKSIPCRYRFSIILARRIYRQIGYKILSERNIINYDKSGKIYISFLEKIFHTILSIHDLIKLIFLKKSDYKTTEEQQLIMNEININERI